MTAFGIQVSNVASLAEHDEVIAQVVQLCRDLFPGAVTWEVDFEPEDPCHRYVVFTVSAKGAPKAIVDRRCQWHERLREISPQFDCRLSIEPE